MKRRDTLPQTFAAQLATLVKEPPEGEEWLHELKYDGYRIGCAAEGTTLRLLSRNGQDWTARFPAMRQAVRDLKSRSILLDGEMTVVLPDGRTSFQALQNAFADDGGEHQLVYIAFDLLYLDGENVARLPLEERKQRLRAVLPKSHRVLRYSDHVAGRGSEVFAAACKAGAEGIVSKQRGLPYQPGRGRGWLKTKCSKRQELVIGGFTEPQGSRAGLGALLVGVHDAGGRLVYSGKVGTGFTQKTADELRRRLDRLETDECPFDPSPRTGVAGAHWVRPVLVAEVEFTEWTEDGKIRHPSFKGLRADKEAVDVIRETPRSTPSPADPAAAKKGRSRRPAGKPRGGAQREVEVAGVRITHPDRIVYPEANLAKVDIAEYYRRIADRILPHLAGRPLSLVRCPQGIGATCFYVKHGNTLRSPHLSTVPIREKTKTGDYVLVDSVEGLISLVQLGVLELHTWNSTTKNLERPDRIVMDLDPGPQVKWPAIIAAARLLRAILADLGLESFVKTTGGRGLHVVVPLKPSSDWDESLAFSRDLALVLERSDPRTYTTAFAKAGREGKILVDYMRNSRGSTSVAAFSTRARASAAVSLPLAWDDLSARRPADYYDVRRILRTLADMAADPWKAYWTRRQRITQQAATKLGQMLGAQLRR